MIVDNTLVFSDSQAITATAASTNVLDLGLPGTPLNSGNQLKRDIGIGCDIPLAVDVTVGFNNLTSLQISLQVATDAAFTTPKEVASRTYLLAEISSAGTRLPFPAEVPEGTNLEFTRLYYTVTGTAPTTGKIFAGIVAGRPAS